MNNMYEKIKEDILSTIDTTEELKQKYLTLIENNPNNFHDRNNLNGHITGSMLVFNADYSKVLLTHHKKFGIWLQLGGHWDDFQESILETAIREMFEEGFGNVEIPYKLVSDKAIDLDIHETPNHNHYDLCYACNVEDENLMVCSDESEEIKWVSVEEVMNNHVKYRERITNLILKVRKHFLN